MTGRDFPTEVDARAAVPALQVDCLQFILDTADAPGSLALPSAEAADSPTNLKQRWTDGHRQREGAACRAGASPRVREACVCVGGG